VDYEFGSGLKVMCLTFVVGDYGHNEVVCVNRCGAPLCVNLSWIIPKFSMRWRILKNEGASDNHFVSR